MASHLPLHTTFNPYKVPRYPKALILSIIRYFKSSSRERYQITNCLTYPIRTSSKSSYYVIQEDLTPSASFPLYAIFNAHWVFLELLDHQKDLAPSHYMLSLFLIDFYWSWWVHQKDLTSSSCLLSLSLSLGLTRIVGSPKKTLLFPITCYL